MIKNRLIKKIKIPLLGIHNIRNSVAAAALSITVGLSVSSVKKGLKNFKGVQRRFNKIFTFNKVDFFDDYAHHPTEIKVVLDGVSNVYKGYEKVCIFQPHRVSRFKDLKYIFKLLLLSKSLAFFLSLLANSLFDLSEINVVFPEFNKRRSILFSMNSSSIFSSVKFANFPTTIIGLEFLKFSFKYPFVLFLLTYRFPDFSKN